MSLHLSSVRLRALQETLEVLLFPLAFPDAEAWRERANERVMALFHADHAVFGVVRGREADLHASNMRSEVVDAMLRFYGAAEPELVRMDRTAAAVEARHHASGAETWSRLHTLQSEARRGSLLLDIVGGARIRHSLNLDCAVPGGAVSFCVSFESAPRGFRLEHELPLLALLAPALKAGTAALLRAGAPRPADAAAERLISRFGLTRREAEVALLLAERLSKREIGERLGLSRHTVRHHAESVFLKLGVHSRLEVVARVAAVPPPCDVLPGRPRRA
jgi:DNA-binding CsgD family transcriptional regulator